MAQYVLVAGQPVAGAPEYTVADGGTYDADHLVSCLDSAGNSGAFLAVFCATGLFE